MLQQIARYISEKQLFKPEDRVLVAVSGGVDSVVLLHALKTLNFSCVVVHCNFHLRGAESDEDENFVRDLANSYGLKFIKTDFDTKTFARENGFSIEMAARELRYDFFEKIRQQENCAVVATAHHLSDSIETFFLNLARGTGLKGLCGISPKNNFIVRPLLFLPRQKIEFYAQKNNLKFRFDSSNNDEIHKRNFIRHKILPQFQNLNPSFTKTMFSNLERLANAYYIYSNEINSQIKSLIINRECFDEIDIVKLQKTQFPSVILYEILSNYGFNSDQTEQIFRSLNAESGKQFFSKTFRIIKDRKSLIISKISKNENQKVAIFEQTSEINFPIKLRFSQIPIENFSLEKSKNVAQFDLQKLKFPLFLRHWQMGDKFFPFGMRGKKKLSDYFSDQKFSLLEKENLWLLTNANDEILWLVGERTDNRFRVSADTKTVLKIEIEQ